MKRILPYSLILASAVAAFACSSKSGNAGAGPDGDPPVDTVPPDENDAGPGDVTEAGMAADTGPAPGTVDPSGNPILLGPARLVRSFTPAGAAPHFVDGPQWIAATSTLYVALPFATNTGGGKGILTRFKSDGTSYTEVRAGDKLTTGVVGNSVDPAGNLISAELKSITRTDPAGAITVLATGYTPAVVTDPVTPVTPFDGPNDLIALADGTIFFTDPGYGVNPRPALGRLGKIAVVAGVTTVTAVDTYDFNPSPNGIALSKDQKSLFVGFTAPAAGTPPFVRKYTVAVDGSLMDKGKFLEMPVGSDPDGMAMDSSDNLYIALKTGIAVYKTTGASGEPYGGATAKVPQTLIDGEPSSISFGGADSKSLFVTTKMGKALELKTTVAGLIQ